jgi:hypothetical protein
MANNRKKTKNGKFWCPGCSLYLLKSRFDAMKRVVNSFYGIQSRCRECQNKKRIQWHSKPESALRELVRRAKHRKRLHTLLPDWAIEQFKQQRGLCFYTNIPMTFIQGKGRVWSNVSIDRVDSGDNYTSSNCVLCCLGFNLMKTNLSLAAMKTLAKAFVDKFEIDEVAVG